MKRRAVSYLIVLAILCGLLSASVLPAFAGGWMEDFTWDETTATLTIHTMDDPYGYLSGADALWYVENNAIPYFAYRDTAEQIVIGSGVEKVLPYSLYGFQKAQSVIIEEGATEIGYAAFAKCAALETVSIADSVTCLRESAFFACESLHSIRISEYVDCLERPFGACTGLNEVVIDANNPSYTFQNGAICNKSGTEIVQCLAANRGAYSIADGVEIIGSDAFRTCDYLTAIEFPHSVTTIEERAFYGCNGLTEITLPESVAVIGDRAFGNCSNLHSITLRNSSCVINGTDALGPSGSTYVYGFVGSTAESYADRHGYYFIDIENPVLPQYSGACGENVTWEYDRESKTLHISGNGAMSDYFMYLGVSSLKPAPWLTVKSEAGVTSIRTKFDIQSVVIHSGVTHLGRWAFSYLYPVTSIEIPDSVTSIGDGAFCRCMSITNITLPNSLMNIGMDAFADCEKLQAINIPASVTEIGGGAFSYCGGLSAISVDERNPAYSSDALGVLFNKDKTELVCVPAGAIDGAYVIPPTVTIIGDDALNGCKGLSNVTIPTGVTRIGTCAFIDCYNLLNVTIPESVTSIGSNAFLNSGCEDNADNWKNGAFFLDHWLLAVNAELPAEYVIPEGTVGMADDVFIVCDVLTDVTIPDSVIGISECAFYGCSNLKGVTIGNGVTSIGDAAFNGCSSLTSVTIPNSVTSIGYGAFGSCSNLKGVTIGNGVTSIGGAAFNGCSSLTSVTIPNSVTSIGDWAFGSCSSLASVYFWGNAPIIGEGVFQTWDAEKQEDVNIPGLTLYYIEGRSGWTAPTWNGYPTATWKPDHQHDYTNTVTAPTCTERGYTTHICECGDSYVDTYVDALGHDYGEWAQTKAPTCTEKGEEKRTCSRCDAFETREIAAHGHTEVIDAAVPATCTEAGKTEGKHCSVCNTVLAEQKTVPALEHDYTDGVCIRCGEKDPNAAPPIVYGDISERDWFYDAVQYATENGLMNGVGGNRFDPNGEMTRAMLVTVLWRYAGQPMGYENKFTDVNAKSGSWYIDAVAWAAGNGIVNGIGNNKFDPNGKITREQMAAILFRYANKNGIDTSKRGNLNSFPDASTVSSWAKDAVQWTVAEGIINGSDGKLQPKGNATRAQVATILMRFIENIVKK